MTSHRNPAANDAFALYSLSVTNISDSTAEISIPPCNVCRGGVGKPRFEIQGTKYSIVECSQCGLGILHPEPTLEELASFYPDDYYGNEGSKFSGLIEPLVRMVGVRRAWFVARQMRLGGRVLDVGCGRGITLGALADSGFETHGFEVSTHAVQGIDQRVQTRIANSLNEAQYPDQYFDGIIIWHVLEHVQNPKSVLSEARRILKPGGRIIVAVPNFSSLQSRWSGPAWFHLDPPRHLFHFPLSALENLLQECGFECQSSHHFSLRQNPFGWIQSALNKLRWLPRNSLYAMLHSHGGEHRSRLSPLLRVQLWLWFWILALPALLLSIVAAILRSGATVHVVATRRENDI
ncbi:MAG: methyltransferase domain-containing protein [Planctomyces sp.]